jgi:hypothetical protein
MQRHLTTATIEVTLYADNETLPGAVAVLDEFMTAIRSLTYVHHAAAYALKPWAQVIVNKPTIYPSIEES